ARRLVIDTMSATKPEAIDRLLAEYGAKVKVKPDLDEVAQMIGNLPPFDPAKELGEKAHEVEIRNNRGKWKYHLQLPPEYSHTRTYPVLVALHDSNDDPAGIVKKWSKAAADQGYILAAPQWGGRLAGGHYRYTPDEQDTVLEMLRDLRRRFNVDSDRVFLFGLGDGGKMAFDVGLSHPDLFAGVLPMSAGPVSFPRKYWRNAQYLPFYVVTGTRMPELYQKEMRDQFTNWVNRHFPALWVEYKGRGTEWFPGEVPMMLDWMRCQKRAFPLTQLGTDGLGGVFGEEFCTVREEDNRFYWLTADAISRRCLMPPGRYIAGLAPAMLTARVIPESNTISVKTTGVGRCTIWIGRDSSGRCMVDLDRPVTVQIGLKELPGKKIVPSLKVLLEDLYHRADRKHLFISKIELR
ncbi:MAG: hypothetical protein K2W96_13080, partial [Gemmataceae bacterium]|nr:hypothetical protein [Gemmataceae bacterium]